MDELNIGFTYSFSSCIGLLQGLRYVREFYMDIRSEDEYGEEIEFVGRVSFKIIYIENAINDNYSLYDIFDSYEYTLRLGQEFFDFDENDFSQKLYKHYDDEILGTNVCILERIEILPKFRKLGIGAKAIKDIVFHFKSECALFVIQPYPLQFENCNEGETEWVNAMEYDQLEKNEKKSKDKLKRYYKKIGFEQVINLPNLLFYNSERRNPRMDSIGLEELLDDDETDL